jgi:hypothetical protein
MALPAEDTVAWLRGEVVIRVPKNAEAGGYHTVQVATYIPIVVPLEVDLLHRMEVAGIALEVEADHTRHGSRQVEAGHQAHHPCAVLMIDREDPQPTFSEKIKDKEMGKAGCCFCYNFLGKIDCDRMRRFCNRKRQIHLAEQQ